MIPDLPTDLRCDHCGELIESDRDDGNEDFIHADTRQYYCGRGDERKASNRGQHKVAMWAALVGHDLARLHAEPQPGEHEVRNAAGDVLYSVPPDPYNAMLTKVDELLVDVAALWGETTLDARSRVTDAMWRGDPAWLSQMTSWAKERNVVSWSVTFGERS